MKFLKSEEDIKKIKPIIEKELKLKNTVISFLGQGDDSFAFEINKNILCKFPKRKKALRGLILETQILKFLENKTSIEIPKMQMIEKEMLFSVHTKIEGKVITEKQYLSLLEKNKNKFAKKLAIHIKELSDIPTKIIKKAIPKIHKIDFLWNTEKLLKHIEPIIKKEQIAVIKEILNIDLNVKKEDFVFGYFDYNGTNMAFDFNKNELNGLFDFADCAIRDIHHNFRSICISFGNDLGKRVFDEFKRISNRKLSWKKIQLYSFGWALWDYEPNTKHEKYTKEKALEWIKVFNNKKGEKNED